MKNVALIIEDSFSAAQYEYVFTQGQDWESHLLLITDGDRDLLVDLKQRYATVQVVNKMGDPDVRALGRYVKFARVSAPEGLTHCFIDGLNSSYDEYLRVLEALGIPKEKAFLSSDSSTLRDLSVLRLANKSAPTLETAFR